MSKLERLSLGRNLGVAFLGLLAGLAVALGGLWVASRAGLVSGVDHRILVAVAAVCLVLAVVPWRQKKPTPEGLAK